MASLLDPLPQDEQQLIDVVLMAHAQTGGWPVVQFVTHQLAKGGIEFDDVWPRMTQWQHNYRSCQRDRMSNTNTDLADRLRLTVYGFANATRRDLANVYLVQFLEAVGIGAAVQREFVPQADAVVELELSAAELCRRVSNRLGTDADPQLLGYLLAGEPATWLGVNFDWSMPQASWTWTLHRRSLAPFAQSTVEAYLYALDTLVVPRASTFAWGAGEVESPSGTPTAEPLIAIPVSPLSLVMMFDYVDTAWRLHAKSHLFINRGLTLGAKLSQPCMSFEDFESRLNAVSDLINSMSVPAATSPGEAGTLLRLEGYLKSRMASGAQSDDLRNAISRLQSVVALRVGHVHSGAQHRGFNAIRDLGLPYLVTNYTDAWAAVSLEVAGALEVLLRTLQQIGRPDTYVDGDSIAT